MTLKQKILLAFVLPALFALAAVWVFVEHSHRDFVIERWSTEHVALVRSIARSIQAKLDDATQALAHTGQLPDFASLSAIDRINPELNGIPPDLEISKRIILDALLGGPNNLAVAFILLPNGDHYIAHPYRVQQSLTKYNLADRSYFREASSSKKTAFSDTIIGSDGMPAVVVDTPLLDSSGEIYGHLGGVFYLSEISRLLSASDIAPFDYGLLADRQGMLIGHSDGSLISAGKTLQKADFPFPDNAQQGGQDITLSQWEDAQGVVWLSFVGHLESGWKFVLSRRLDSITAEIAPAVRQITLLVAIILIVTGSIGIALVARFAKRWEESDQQLRLAHDHLELRVAQRTAELSQSQERLSLAASVFRHTREGIIIADPDGKIVDANQGFSAITGYQRDEVIGRSPEMLNGGQQSPEFYKAMWQELRETGKWHGELWNQKKSGETYIELLDLSSVRNQSGEIAHYVGIFSDISQQKNHEQHLEKLAHFDPLTGLPNRTLLHDRLHMSISQAGRNKTQLAVCMLDLDGFKAVNDTYGHAAGDRLLIDFSRRTQNTLRDTDTLARLGGDEFVILLNDLNNLEQGMEVIRRVLAEASHIYEIDGNLLTISASVGVTVFPDDGVDPDLLLRHADQAMYIAKQTGRNRYFLFDPMKDQAARAELAAIKALETALVNQEFELHYQPKVDMPRGIVTGAEALIRWRHPERGLVSPAEFLPLTENNDFAITLGDWVIREALRQADAWHHQGLHLSISVNIAARHLSLPDFTARLGQMLSLHPTLPHGRIELEILETAALSDTAHVSEVIESCRQLGISFALDDFGTGYSSLLYLKHLPAETLKIDQSFVRDMKIDAEDLAIVKGVIGLAQAFNRSVIAEGVESTELGDMLLDLGCTHAQGYGIARPMPPSAFREWLAGWKAPASWLVIRPGQT